MPALPIPGLDREGHATMLALMQDLRYPAGPNGEILGFAAEAIAPIVAYQLTMCGWRLDMRKRKRKARKISGPGVMEDAVVWRPVSEPDGPIVYAGPAEPVPGWHTETRVSITDAPEEEE